MLLRLSFLLLSSFVLLQLSLCAPASVSANPAINGVPIHVPICRKDRGGFDRLVCARLLVALKNLPYYYDVKIWSDYATGDGHLPAVFSFVDRSGTRSCYLTMDLYEPGIPKTAKERFSLEQVQTDLNNIYHECIKTQGVGGFNRIGLVGNVAALLGPSLGVNNALLGPFRGFGANQTEAQSVLSNHEVFFLNLRQFLLRTHLASPMLPEQASGTNPTASTTTFAESPFNSFLSSDNSSAIEYLLDPIKIEQDDNTNPGYRQNEQQPRRETQQQKNMARPGQIYAYEQNDDDETALRAAIESALVAENPGDASLDPSGRIKIKRPCTPPQQINICK
ncbi:MAG: hypothetical protein Q9216_002384 [Gyalolechia sp. 2 TL-2023]